jgi:hypothetical protein
MATDANEVILIVSPIDCFPATSLSPDCLRWMSLVLVRFRSPGVKMSVFKRGLVFAARYIRNLRGGSQPILVEATDGLIYVVKFTNNLQGANLPFNESAGSELYSALGLACPAWRPIFISDTFLDRNPECWIHNPDGSLLRPATGLTFGSRFLGGGMTRLLEILPETSFKRVTNRESFWLAWLIDICAMHADNRQTIFVESAKGEVKAYFVDHGHLFGGPNGREQKSFLGLRYLDPRIYQGVSSSCLLNLARASQALDIDLLWKRIQDLPHSWKTSSALDSFSQCLGVLSNTKLMQGIVDTLLYAYLRSNGFEYSDSPYGRKPAVGVLRPGVQASGLGNIPVARSAARRACA